MGGRATQERAPLPSALRRTSRRNQRYHKGCRMHACSRYPRVSNLCAGSVRSPTPPKGAVLAPLSSRLSVVSVACWCPPHTQATRSPGFGFPSLSTIDGLHPNALIAALAVTPLATVAEFQPGAVLRVPGVQRVHARVVVGILQDELAVALVDSPEPDVGVLAAACP